MENDIKRLHDDNDDMSFFFYIAFFLFAEKLKSAIFTKISPYYICTLCTPAIGLSSAQNEL